MQLMPLGKDGSLDLLLFYQANSDLQGLLEQLLGAVQMLLTAMHLNIKPEES